MSPRPLARVFFAFWAAACAQAGFAAPLPQVDPLSPAAPLAVRYDLRLNGVFVADVVETLSLDGAGGYRIESEARARGLAKFLVGDIRRKSEGLWDGAFRPVVYEEERGTKRRYRAAVDRERGIVDLTRGADKRAETAPLPAAPLNDYLTAAYRSYAAGRAIDGETAVTDGRRVKVYRYRAEPEESIDTAFGTLRAAPVVRLDGRRVVFWLAPDLRFLPARIELETSAGEMVIEIAAVESPPRPAAE